MANSILFIQEIIPHYRVPIFNRLNDFFDVTIAAEKFSNPTEYAFKTHTIKTYTKGPFVYYDKQGLNFDDYDVVIHMFNIRWINILLLLLNSFRKYKLILWGIGVSTENGLDNDKKWDWMRYLMAKKSDAVIFYSQFPISKYIAGGVKGDKIFVAHNTLNLTPQYSDTLKTYFIFIGSLIKYKKIDELIDTFSNIVNKIPSHINLKIVGDGPYLESTYQLVKDKNLLDRINFLGRIEDEDSLKPIYAGAIANISPGQAGLSVLQSMAFGVPFVTRSNAITGGERFNITHNENGLFYSSTEELENIFIDLANDEVKTIRLGKAAFNYFKESCSVQRMIDGFSDAIHFSLTRK
jgi:glycosyltransferase involved in cell wall biosynthesis